MDSPTCLAGNCKIARCPTKNLPDLKEKCGTALCKECNCRIDVSRLAFTMCPHTVFSQITANMPTNFEDVPPTLKMPSSIYGKATYNTVDTELRFIRDSLSSLVLVKSDDNRITVGRCTRNLVLHVRSKGKFNVLHVLRGMNMYPTEFLWPATITILPPMQITGERQWPCKLLQRLSSMNTEKIHCDSAWLDMNACLFSADFQYITHPVYNSHINAEPVVGAFKLFDTKYAVLNGIFCTSCRRVWELAGTGDVARCIESCGEPGMVDAQLHTAHTTVRKIEPPQKYVVSNSKALAIERDVMHMNQILKENGAFIDMIDKFRWIDAPTNSDIFPVGCVAILVETASISEKRHGEKSIAMFLSGRHAEIAKRSPEKVSIADVMYWVMFVHPRKRWKEVSGRRFFTLSNGKRELMFPKDSYSIMDLISIKGAVN